MCAQREALKWILSWTSTRLMDGSLPCNLPKMRVSKRQFVGCLCKHLWRQHLHICPWLHIHMHIMLDVNNPSFIYILLKRVDTLINLSSFSIYQAWTISRCTPDVLHYCKGKFYSLLRPTQTLQSINCTLTHWLWCFSSISVQPLQHWATDERYKLHPKTYIIIVLQTLLSLLIRPPHWQMKSWKEGGRTQDQLSGATSEWIGFTIA